MAATQKVAAFSCFKKLIFTYGFKMVRAKFKCEAVVDRRNEYGNYRTVEMRAVTSSSGENKAFTEFTPSGEFKMAIDEKAAAYDYFQSGQCYYFDISEAPAQ